jgi:hypothetical protein
MLTRTLTAAVVSIGLLPGAALAQSGSTTASTQAQTTQTLPQEIRQKLSKQGFTDVKVVPGSFIVSAKDKDGDPVSMVIGPHSMTMFTFTSAGNGSNTGSSSSTGAQGSGK